ncbi:MAG: SDR family oxidoreductase [Myxococcales bacterium]|nr:SDR family oxidoreductase [Myxococcales bacterium]
MTRADARPRVVVFGGTGAVGSALLVELARRGCDVVFTYFRNEALAQKLWNELGFAAVALDLREPGRVRALAEGLERDQWIPTAVIHCAGVLETSAITDATDEAWEGSMAINARSAGDVCREFGRRMSQQNKGDLVFVGGLDRAQSLPIPPVYAATQGMLSALCMAAAKELGPRGVRVNMAALGLLDQGSSLALDPKLREQYRAFSALRRFGTTSEAARAIAWLALDNSYVNGKVLPVNGGI